MTVVAPRPDVTTAAATAPCNYFAVVGDDAGRVVTFRQLPHTEDPNHRAALGEVLLASTAGIGGQAVVVCTDQEWFSALVAGRVEYAPIDCFGDAYADAWVSFDDAVLRSGPDYLS